jgi:hypothetical protein
MKNLNQYILKSYPNAKDIQIVEVFTAQKGWVECLSNPLVYNSINHLNEIGVSNVNIKLTDEFGQIRRPDYSIKEILNYIKS